MRPSGSRTAFVMVGTTKFDALVAAADDPALADALVARGFVSLAVQAGAGGAYAPHRLLGPGVASGTTPAGLAVAFFDYAPSLAAHVAAADLVISHAGSGCLFESLGAGKALVAVPNGALMANHQAELARALADAGVLLATEPAQLAAVVRGADFGALQPYTPGSPAGIVAAIDALAGRGEGGGVGKEGGWRQHRSSRRAGRDV